jgi:hypothetical protein
MEVYDDTPVIAAAAAPAATVVTDHPASSLLSLEPPAKKARTEA